MYHDQKTYVRPETRVAEMISENPPLLLMLEHFGVEPGGQGWTVARLCDENRISERVFITFANIYNGFYPSSPDHLHEDNIPLILYFLKNSHRFYKAEKYPEIRLMIEQISVGQAAPEVGLLAEFFDNYFVEVTEHLDYEDQVAFPYISKLVSGTVTENGTAFSVEVYLDHHTDIEVKLTDLKNLLLMHISLRQQPALRRKLLFSLFELEYDLNIHSLIEESILIPLVRKMENKERNA